MRRNDSGGRPTTPAWGQNHDLDVSLPILAIAHDVMGCFSSVSRGKTVDGGLEFDDCVDEWDRWTEPFELFLRRVFREYCYVDNCSCA